MLAGLLLMQGCGKSNTFTITGTVDTPDFNGLQMYLVQDYCLIDSTVIENCSFTFSGTVDEPYIAELHTESDSNGGLYLILVVEPGNITATITHNDVTDRVGGTLLNDRLQSYKSVDCVDTLALTAEAKAHMDSLYAICWGSGNNSEECQKAYEEIQSIYAPVNSRKTARLWDLYHNNEDNVLSCYAVSLLEQYDSNMNKAVFLDSLIATANEKVSSMLQPTVKVLRAQEATAGGKSYVNINGIVKIFEDGEWKESQGSLKDLIDGKPAIVDFWASWCGPCRQEISENLIALSDKYKGKAVVVGVDVWDSIDLHTKAVADLGVYYSQLIDTTSYATDTYGITGIPEIMVINSKGVIVERGLRGPFIEAALQKALNE